MGTEQVDPHILIRTSIVKELILKLEPDGITQKILEANGWGKSSSFGSTFSVEYFWNWNKEKIMKLTDEELLKLINEIIWT